MQTHGTLLLVGLLFYSWGAYAQSDTSSGAASFHADSALFEALAHIQGEPLSLTAAVELALEHATAIREAEAAVAAAAGTWMLEKGGFDPELFLSLNRSSSETPSSSPFSRPDVINEEVRSGAAGARLRLPIGTELQVAVDARELDTNSEFAAIDPEYRAGGALSLRQPLLKGFGVGASAPRRAAEQSALAAREALRQAILGTRAAVEASYWELHAAERNYAVQQLIVGQAEALLDQAQLRAEAGLAGSNEVANARVFLAQQRLAALDQEERLDSVSDRLVTLIGIRPREGQLRYRPTDDPEQYLTLPRLDALLERAYRQNAALQEAEYALAAAETRARGLRRQALPQLDLIGSIGGSGLAGSSREVIFGGDTLRTAVDGGYQAALGDVLGRDFPAWAIGLEVSLPLGLRAGRGERERADAETDRARQRVEAVRRSIDEGIRIRHRELRHGSLRLELAREGVAAAFEQVRIGLIEYENGRATAFELVRLGADLAAAEQRLSEALVRTAGAAAALRSLTAAESLEDL